MVSRETAGTGCSVIAQSPPGRIGDRPVDCSNEFSSLLRTKSVLPPWLCTISDALLVRFPVPPSVAQQCAKSARKTSGKRGSAQVADDLRNALIFVQARTTACASAVAPLWRCYALARLFLQYVRKHFSVIWVFDQSLPMQVGHQF